MTREHDCGWNGEAAAVGASLRAALGRDVRPQTMDPSRIVCSGYRWR